jgi:hypothetical protein
VTVPLPGFPLPPSEVVAIADRTGCPICGRDSCEGHWCPFCGADNCKDHRCPICDRDVRGTPDVPNDHVLRDEADRVQRILRETERLRVRRAAERQLEAEERGPIIAPQIVTLSDLLAEPEPAIAWRLDAWQPAETRVMLAAAHKTGKTTLTGSLVRSLVDGELWLGRHEVQVIQGTVTVIDTEMARRQLRRWYRDLGITRTKHVRLIPLRGQAALFDVLNPSLRAQWAAWLQAINTQYLILDCLRPVLDALGLDEHRDAGRLLVGVDALLRGADIPEACVVHHMGHTGERSRGDSRLRDWPDVEWRLMRQDAENDSSLRYIAAYGRDVDQSEQRLAYDFTTRRLTVSGGSRKQMRVEGALDTIVHVLSSSEALSGRGVKDALSHSDHSRESVEAALKLGVRSGRLVVTNGRKNSRLYAVSQCPAVSELISGHSLLDRVSECPPPSIEGDTPDASPATEMD